MNSENKGFLVNLSPFWRTVISLILAAGIFLPLYMSGENLLFSLICAWLGFALGFLVKFLGDVHVGLGRVMGLG